MKLPHKNCSCDLCRAVRKADKIYQAELRDKWRRWLEIENTRIMANARAHDDEPSSLCKDNVAAVRQFRKLKQQGVI